MKIFIIFDFPVPLLRISMKTTAKTSKIHTEDSNLLLLPITGLLQRICFDRPNISVYLKPKKHLKESNMIFKNKHSRVTKKMKL